MIRFSDINQSRGKNYKPNYQRHHLIPREAETKSPLHSMFKIMEKNGFDLDDFSQNGILLPCCEKEALRTGRPLHRGPHPLYNHVVIERLLKISKLGEQFECSAQRLNFLSYRVSILLSALHTGLNERKFQKIQLSFRDPMSGHLRFDQMNSRIDQYERKPSPQYVRRVRFTLKSMSVRNLYVSEL